MLCTTLLGQVGVTISNMQYISGTPINNCGNIDFGTNSTVRIQFTTNLTKQSTQMVGNSNLYIYTVGSSGVRFERSNVIVQPINFNTNLGETYRGSFIACRPNRRGLPIYTCGFTSKMMHKIS